MHQLAESFEFAIMKKNMFSKWIVQNREMRQFERMYMKKVHEKTFRFLEQFMMVSTMEVYNIGWDSHMTEIGINYTLKEKMGYDPVIHGNNDPFRWAKIISSTDWVGFYLKRQIDVMEKQPPVKVFNQPGIDEPDGIVARFTGNTEILTNAKDVDGFVSVTLAYVEVYSEGQHVYELTYIVILSDADYRSMLEGTYFYSGSGSNQGLDNTCQG
jgi:hypothetical protein